jgi:TPR repeat protein
MKTTWLILGILECLTIRSPAQLTHNQSIGAFSMPRGGGGIVSQNPRSGADITRKEYRKIDGKVYSTLEMGLVDAKVSYLESENILILQWEKFDGTETIALKNYPQEAISGKSIYCCAKRMGVYNWNGTPVGLWDYGIKPTADEIKEKQAQEFEEYKKTQAQQEFERIRLAAIAKANQDARDAQKQATAARVLKLNQDAAAKGDLFGLLRMGERYRDGDGVEKDLAKAKEYLQKAADAGSPTAVDELSKLKQ